MENICQTCGGSGFSVAMIYCEKCQVYVVHRYCLDKLPATFDEYVSWFCVDCESKVLKPSTLGHPLPARKSGSGLTPKKRKRKSRDYYVRRKKNNKKRRNFTDSFAKSEIQTFGSA